MKILKTIAIMLFMIHCSLCFAVHIKKTDEEYMQMALTLAAKENPKFPFAALIVNQETGEILSQGVNAAKINPTFHAEMVAINNCIKQHPNVDWSKVTLYTTAEPCAMCQSAVIWTKIPRVVFATSMEYLLSQGWDQIKIHAKDINTQSPFYKGSITPGILAEKANLLFKKKDFANGSRFIIKN